MHISRRAFVLAGAGLPALVEPSEIVQASPDGPPQSDRPLTASDVVDRIRANVGIPWMSQTVDTIVAGAPEARVAGIAVSMMATLDVLQRAAAAGRNMVVTHEPTFYSHQDRTDGLLDDPTYQFKAEFIQRHGMAVFHFHDHWHRRRPDGIAVGMARELGWDAHAVPENPREFVLPEQSLAQLARGIASRLGIRTVRVVGDPAMPVTRVLASWGNVSLVPGIPYLARQDVDVLIVGETREWEVVEYVQDQIASGRKKGLIVLGHVVSEQAGMKYCAEWLRSFISEVPVDFVPAPEPFWAPDSPVSRG